MIGKAVLEEDRFFGGKMEVEEEGEGEMGVRGYGRKVGKRIGGITRVKDKNVLKKGK